MAKFPRGLEQDVGDWICEANQKVDRQTAATGVCSDVRQSGAKRLITYHISRLNSTFQQRPYLNCLVRHCLFDIYCFYDISPVSFTTDLRVSALSLVRQHTKPLFHLVLQMLRQNLGLPGIA